MRFKANVDITPLGIQKRLRLCSLRSTPRWGSGLTSLMLWGYEIISQAKNDKLFIHITNQNFILKNNKNARQRRTAQNTLITLVWKGFK